MVFSQHMKLSINLMMKLSLYNSEIPGVTSNGKVIGEMIRIAGHLNLRQNVAGLTLMMEHSIWP